MILPGEPSGSGSLVSWLRRLREFVRSLELKSGKGYMVRRSNSGTVLEIRPGSGGGGAPVTRYRVQSVHDKVLVCHTWDGTTEGTDDVYVAKPPKLRHTITTATVDGTVLTYSYSTVASNLDKQRDATNGTITESQFVTPRWLLDDEIYGIEIPQAIAHPVTAGSVVSTLETSVIDLNLDARAWAAESL